MTDEKITISDEDISAAKPIPPTEPKSFQQTPTHESYQPTPLPKKEGDSNWLRYCVLFNFFLTLLLLGAVIYFALSRNDRPAASPAIPKTETVMPKTKPAPPKQQSPPKAQETESVVVTGKDLQFTPQPAEPKSTKE